jgi:hypothetical protein
LHAACNALHKTQLQLDIAIAALHEISSEGATLDGQEAATLAGATLCRIFNTLAETTSHPPPPRHHPVQCNNHET